MKFRIVKQERLDGSFQFQPQRKQTGTFGWFHPWINLDSDGDSSCYNGTRDTFDEALAIIQKAKTKYRSRTIKCLIVIPL